MAAKEIAGERNSVDEGSNRDTLMKGSSFVAKKKKMQRKGIEMSCLPRDMEEEVLSRVPVRALRSTCKKWNTLTKSESFVVAKKKQRKGMEVVVMLDYRVSLMSVHLLHSPSIERIGGNVNADGVEDVSKIFHCDGLFLCCITNLDKPSSSRRLLVWNPFLGQTRWIEFEPTSSYHRYDTYALGYGKEKKEHKVLRFLNYHFPFEEHRRCEFEIYSLHSNSWKQAVYDFTSELDWRIFPTRCGLSLKGNTYWYANNDKAPGPPFLLSFDFTTERFGPRLPLPFHGLAGDTVTLSSVREEQLAVLFQKRGALAAAYTVKIWITTKIEPNAVSWSNLFFIAVDMKPLIGFPFSQFSGSFFLDEEKKVAVVLDRERDKSGSSTRNVAYIIGCNGYFKQVDLGESRDLPRRCYPRVCSYVPSSSSVQITTPP